MDTVYIMGYVLPIIKTLLWLVIGLGGLIGVGYYLFVVKRRKVWNVNVYEKRADGKLHLVLRDKIIEKKINKGKQTVFIMKKVRAEVMPPPYDCVNRLFSKEYVDYLRIEDEYIAMKKDVPPIEEIMGESVEEKKKFIKKIRDQLAYIKSLSRREIDTRFIYLPINKVLHTEMKYKPLEYDINMMRINAIENREKIYADKQDWMQKYGTFLAMGAIIVLIIVVLYLSYDYSSNVINVAMGKAQQTLSMVEQLAGKMGGTPPPS